MLYICYFPLFPPSQSAHCFPDIRSSHSIAATVVSRAPGCPDRDHTPQLPLQLTVAPNTKTAVLPGSLCKVPSEIVAHTLFVSSLPPVYCSFSLLIAVHQSIPKSSGPNHHNLLFFAVPWVGSFLSLSHRMS